MLYIWRHIHVIDRPGVWLDQCEWAREIEQNKITWSERSADVTDAAAADSFIPISTIL